MHVSWFASLERDERNKMDDSINMMPQQINAHAFHLSKNTSSVSSLWQSSVRIHLDWRITPQYKMERALKVTERLKLLQWEQCILLQTFMINIPGDKSAHILEPWHT
jgi:hypothetical protein